MKKIITGLAVVCIASTAAQAQLKKEVQIVQRKPAPVAKKAIPIKAFTVAEISATSGKEVKPTDMVKTLSGKSITVEEYLRRINKIEAGLAANGTTLRNFKPSGTMLNRKPAVLAESKINAINTELNKNVKPLLNLRASTNKILMHKMPRPTTVRASQIVSKNQALYNKIIEDFKKKQPKTETIEETYDVNRLLKPLADRINASLDDDEAQFSLANASLVVRSHAVPPTMSLAGRVDADLFGSTDSEYKVAVNFGASMKVSAGLPITITIPLATMNGEFIAPSKSSKKLSRKVVVNLLGRSLFNRTSVVTGNTLEEEDQEELDIAELINSPAMSTTSFIDGLPSVGFNTDISTMGAVGCMYKVDMTRTNVDAYIGPTYSTRLRVAASYGIEDILEGGIEGIITLLTGGVGFGGNAGLDYEDNKWKLVNTAYVETTLEALKGEVNFFVRYPDPTNWCAFLVPCIKKETFTIFKTPTAFRLTGTLLEDDNSKNINW